MSIEVVYRMRRDTAGSDLRELDRVAVVVPVLTDDDDTIAAGTVGTIVSIWRDGAAYEVEFAEPVGALATIEAVNVRLVERAGV